MIKFDSEKLYRALLFLAMVLSIAPDGFGQHFAKASENYRISKHLQSTAQRIAPDERTLTLKDALQELKKRFHLKFAYRQGLLEGKVVLASLLEETSSPEEILRKILSTCDLRYKQITKKQFSIFSSSDVAGVLPMPDPLTSSASELEQGADKVVTGTVTAKEDAQPLPGVSILLKGTSNGTTTNAEGKYTISIPEAGGTLVFSFIGYAQQEVTVTSQTTIDIEMQQEITSLSEVVITALGIARDKKALAYAVTEVKGDEFTQAREANVANALSGKIAGVNATGLSTGPGGSSRIIIRGNGSLTGANQPLYVVNGMPIDNTTPGGSPTTNGITNNVDRGDGISGINPDDIESISVLKGGTAAALYGSRAANGVIVITTKKGKAQRGIGVEYNSTYTMDKVAVFPDWQYEYGQGDLGRKPATAAEGLSWGRRSWGQKIDGSEFFGADGNTHPYIAQKDNIKKFYQTGTNFTNTLAFTGGGETITYRFSLSDMNSKSILPNTTFNRKTGNLNVNGKFGERISIEALAQYNLEQANNRPTAGDALGNPNWTPYMIANTADIEWFEPGYDASGNEIGWNDADIASNSYFVINKFQQNDRKNRFIGQGSIQYNFLKNLSVKGTVSRDFYNYNYRHILPTGAKYVPKGEFSGLKTDVAETNGMIMLNYNTKFADIIGFSALAGANRRNFEYEQSQTTGSQFIIPYFYSPTNLATSSTIPSNQRTRTNSVFGSIDADYKSIAFLSLTGRQDWFSTLSPENNSIFYPSVGGSFILSEAVQLPRVFDFAKFRASWAQVGGATPDPYVINLTYSMVPSSGIPLQNVTSNTITNANLKPLTSTTFEVGMDLRLFNRLGIDFTYYDRKTTDDIVTTAITPTSGYNNVILNVGELSNKGIEVQLNVTPIKRGDFTWDVNYNIAYNQNEVVRLADGLNSIQMATTVNNYAYVNNIVGEPYGSIVGTRKVRDANGAIVYNPTTGVAEKTGLLQLGNGVPPLTMGLTNEFQYKDFSFNFLIDGKFGNKVFSIMEVYAIRLGLLKSTLPGRDGGLEVEGVTREGAPFTRTVPVDQLRIYYDNEKNYSELFLHDGSFVKLRQVVLTYKLPVSKLKFVKIQSASLSFVGRNLAILYKKTDNFDPEQSFTNGSAQGFESFGLPRTRNYGLNLMVKF